GRLLDALSIFLFRDGVDSWAGAAMDMVFETGAMAWIGHGQGTLLGRFARRGGPLGTAPHPLRGFRLRYAAVRPGRGHDAQAAGAVRKQALEEVQGAIDGLRASVWAEITGPVIRAPAHCFNTRVRFVGNANGNIALVVAEQNVVPRPILLDQVALDK